MSGAVPPLPQYAFMAWCSVKKAQGQLYLYLALIIIIIIIIIIIKPSELQSEARMVLDRSNTGTGGSNPARGMDGCMYVHVFLCRAVPCR
jgi:hypothetical protein